MTMFNSLENRFFVSALKFDFDIYSNFGKSPYRGRGDTPLPHPRMGHRSSPPIDLMHWRHKGSRLHNNGARLVSRSAHVLCWQCALALSLSVRGPGRASPAVWQCRGCPPGCMLGDDARGSASFDPQRSWAPFCDVICIWSIVKTNRHLCYYSHLLCSRLEHLKSYWEPNHTPTPLHPWFDWLTVYSGWPRNASGRPWTNQNRWRNDVSVPLPVIVYEVVLSLAPSSCRSISSPKYINQEAEYGCLFLLFQMFPVESWFRKWTCSSERNPFSGDGYIAHG